MKTVKVVGAVIINERHEILCALRSENMLLPDLWEFPGGKIEQGEQPEQALIREIHEELDCLIDVEEFIMEVTHHYLNFIVNLLTYKAKITQGKPVAKEHAKLKWVPLHELTDLNWAPADIPTVKKLLENV